MEIYERIFELLKEKGMTQAELSKKTGIRVSTISDWKNKKGNPSADKIMIICEALDVSPYMLLSGSDSKYNKTDYITIKSDSDEAYLIETYQSLSQKNAGRLLGYAEALKSGGERN